MKNYYILIPFLLLIMSKGTTQSLNANELIEKSIKFHDPLNEWTSFQNTLNLKQENPKNSDRIRTIFLDIKESSFTFEGSYPEGTLQYSVNNKLGRALWNRSELMEDSIRTKYRISSERAFMYRNYYSYLYGMPMKLKDPGTIINPSIDEVIFHGKEYYKISVKYDESVGSDTWSFYFDKQSYKLGAYEFWKKKPDDGEYLLLDGIKEIGGVKLPEKIAWYMTEGDRWLGTDIIQ